VGCNRCRARLSASPLGDPESVAVQRAPSPDTIRFGCKVVGRGFQPRLLATLKGSPYGEPRAPTRSSLAATVVGRGFQPRLLAPLKGSPYSEPRAPPRSGWLQRL